MAYLIAVVHQDEEEVKAAHDGGGQVDILLQTLAAVVAPTDRVGGSQDGRASVQGGLEETEAGYFTADTERLLFKFGSDLKNKKGTSNCFSCFGFGFVML